MYFQAHLLKGYVKLCFQLKWTFRVHLSIQLAKTNINLQKQNVCQKYPVLFFLNPHRGYFANSVDPDQPAFSEAGWSEYILFVVRFTMYAMLHDLVTFWLPIKLFANIECKSKFYLHLGETVTRVKVFMMNLEFRILRLTFHSKSASTCWIKDIMIASLIGFQSI